MQLRRASNASPVTLGKELGRGGEGAVHLVKTAPDLVAKVYHKPPPPAKVEKLRSMARHSSPTLLRVAAWPIDVLVDESGLVRGFLMRKVSAREDLHELYSPKSRRRAFPTADFRFIVRVAANLARAIAQVHAQGNVIGDVNHGNALVGRDGTVLLIDCDSFQIRSAGRVFTCDVGVPLFTAPELHGQGFRGMKRTPDHDAFGLAVLLFHLLYLGRHPFAGRFADGEMTIERAIAEHRFVYGVNAEASGMSPPPATLPLSSFGPEIAQLFERAFARGGASRPTPVEWVAALESLERSLVVCGASDIHLHPADRHCAWCAHEQATGIQVFTRQVNEMVVSAAAKVARLWDHISTVPRPKRSIRTDLAEIPRSQPSPSAEDTLGSIPRTALTTLLTLFGLATITAGGLPVGLGYLAAAGGMIWHHFRYLGRQKPKADIRSKVAEARFQVARFVSQWNELCADERFEHLYKRLEKLKDRLQELQKLRAEKLKALQDDAARRQRDNYLSMFRIDKANLKLLSRQDISMLAAWDIDSADDLFREKLEFPRSIKPAARRQLYDWAARAASGFRFDAALGVDPRDLQVLDESLYSAQRPLVAQLEHGSQELQKLSEEFHSRGERIERDLTGARSKLDQLVKEAV